MSTATLHSNLAGIVLAHAETRPDLDALVIPTEFDDLKITTTERLTYGELADRVARVRSGLRASGLVEGDRVVVMFPVSLELYILVLALLASGMVAVFVDTGMGKERVIQALELSKAKAIVSVDALLKYWPFLKVLRGRKRFSVDRRRLGVKAFSSLVDHAPTPDAVRERRAGDSALMTFTSGSTGTPRAANRTHDILVAQHVALSEEFPEGEGEVDMPCFPVVPLHNLCCGITTVMPAVDLRAPATVAPGLVLDQVAEHGVTRMSGAPAYLSRLADEMEKRGSGLESVTTLGAGGAPVPRPLCERLVRLMPQCRLLVIYGSTEAEPMTSITMQELVETPGDGYLVGRVSEAATLALVDLSDKVPVLDDREMAPFEVSPGEVGEVVVRGPHVLKGYVDDPAADAETKLRAPDGGVWHRTGDMGRWDDQSRLWLVGRLKDQVRVEGRLVDPYPVEAELDRIDGVSRSALVQTHDGPTAFLEVEHGHDEHGAPSAGANAARGWLDAHGLASAKIVVVPTIPMDNRHNSKVDRPALRAERDASPAI